MRLKKLAAQTGTSTASIKYYLREGLLPPGRRINATLAEYDDSHVARLNLIGALRQIVGSPIEEIRALVTVLDDPAVDLYSVYGRAQLLGLGLPGDAGVTPGEEPAEITRLVEARGWVEAVEVRALLAEQVRHMNALGVATSADTLEAYADAADRIARRDVGVMAESASVDEAVMRVAVGVHEYSRLLLRMLGVAQAGHARGARRGDGSGQG